MRSQHSASKGFSLVEILLVLGGIAILTVGSFLVYPAVKASNQAQVEQENITLILTGVDNMIGASSSYSYQDIDMAVLNDSHIPPRMMRDSDRTDAGLISAWGGYISIGPWPSLKGLAFFYAEMPSAVCAKLLPLMDARAKGFNVDDVWIKHPSIPKPSVEQYVNACKSTGRPGRPGLDVYLVF